MIAVTIPAEGACRTSFGANLRLRSQLRLGVGQRFLRGRNLGISGKLLLIEILCVCEVLLCERDCGLRLLISRDRARSRVKGDDRLADINDLAHAHRHRGDDSVARERDRRNIRRIGCHGAVSVDARAQGALFGRRELHERRWLLLSTCGLGKAQEPDYDNDVARSHKVYPPRLDFIVASTLERFRHRKEGVGSFSDAFR